METTKVTGGLADHVYGRLRREWERARSGRMMLTSESSLYSLAVREERSAAKRCLTWRDKHGLEPFPSDAQWSAEMPAEAI